MVKVSSSAGGFVNIEVIGISEAIRAIMAKGKQILDGKDAKTLQAANFLQQEVQESIMGNRNEPKSVNTGNFANSIKIDKIQDMKYAVYTDVDYAQFLEYGTIHILPRSHFRNSLNRNKEKIVEIIKQ